MSTSRPPDPRLCITGLCITGFFLAFKPSEPYLTPFLMESFTEEEVNELIYPVFTYSSFAFILPTGLLAEVIGYKHIVMSGIFMREATRIMLLWGTTILHMQIMQAFFGFAFACEIVFFSYVYLVVPKRDYIRATGWLHAVSLFGHTAAGLCGQLLVSVFHVPLRSLLYVSLVSVTAGLLAFVFMPRVNKQRTVASVIREYDANAQISFNAIVSASRHFFDVFREPHILLWSLWWWLGYAVLGLVMNYDTSLFHHVSPDSNYNGVVLACGRLAAAVGALLPSRCPTLVKEKSALLAAGVSSVACGFLLVSVLVEDIRMVYASFVLFYGVMEFLIISASAGVAMDMNTLRFAAVFTVNSFVALFVQTVEQLLLRKFGANIIDKYWTFFVHMCCVSVLFFILGWGTWRSRNKRLPSAEAVLEPGGVPIEQNVLLDDLEPNANCAAAL